MEDFSIKNLIPVIVILFIMILSSLFIISQSSPSKAVLSKSTLTDISRPSYEIHNYSQSSNNLTVFSNSQLIQVAQTNGWTGDGSKANPILIGNFSISNAYPYALQFENVNLWVKIYNITITKSNGGISLIHVKNFLFENISISNLYYQYDSLVIDSSNNVNITNFTITDYTKQISIKNSRNLTLSNFNIVIQSASDNFGITILNSQSIEFNNNSIALLNPNFIIGVSVYNSSSVSMSKNNFETNSSFYVQNSENFTLKTNFIKSAGLTFDTTPGLVIEYNIMEGKGIQFNIIGFDYPIQYEHQFQYLITNNSINGLPLLYYYNKTNIFIHNDFYQALLVLCNNISFQKSSFQQIDLLHSENITINDSTFVDVNMLESDDITINNCDVSGTVFFLSTNNVFISGNIFNFNKDKIDSLLAYPLHKNSNQYTEDYYIKSNNITIVYNTFHNKVEMHSIINSRIEGNKFFIGLNTESSDVFNGIEIYLSKNIEIIGNELGEKLAKGILLTDSDNVTLLSNNIINNYGVGITLFNTSNARIMNNTILKNSRGIEIEEGTNIDILNNDISEQKEKYVSIGGSSRAYYDFTYGYGIYLINSSNIIIINNKIRFNSKSAIYETKSYNITSKGNIIEWNGDQVSFFMMIIDVLLVFVILIGLGIVVYFKAKQGKLLRMLDKKDKFRK